MERKRKKEKGNGALKAVLITVSVLVLLAGAAAAVYFLAFGTVTIVSDTSFRQVVPSGTYSSLRLTLALEGKRLKVVTFPDQYFNSTEVFRSAMASVKGNCLILTPVPAAYAVINQIDVSELRPDTVVIGIHDSTGSAFFDVTLVSDEMSGWKAAASAIQTETASMPQNIALVYETTVDELAQGIIDAFPAGHVTEFRKEGSSRMFASTSADKMDEHGIVLAMCPYVSGLSNFFSTVRSVSWIVDYRFASVVPQINLYGVVVPDFSSLPGIIDSAEKGTHMVESLDYVYEKR